jgi:hypothetical protein
MMAKERFVPLAELQPHLAKLQSAIGAGDPAGVRACLQDLVSPDQHNDRLYGDAPVANLAPVA